MTYEVKKALRTKHAVYKKYKDRKHPACKKANSAADKAIKTDKREFEIKLAEKIKDDKKSFFAYVGSKKKGASTVGPLANGSGELIADPQMMAEIFNNQFCAVFSQEDMQSIPVIPEHEIVNCSLENIEISAGQIESKLARLREDKAPGPDELHPRLLKMLGSSLTHPLLIIFRKSFEEAVIPTDWKCANISPIYKKGTRSEPLNYRPVSLTSQIGKLMETVLKENIVTHLENNILNNSQHGFRSGRSCQTNLLKFLNEVADSMQQGEEVDTIYLDFAKAFNKVPHGRLICKLEAIGIRGQLLNWIRSWLSERKQRVCIKGRVSG
jgi:hypothetical protein